MMNALSGVIAGGKRRASVATRPLDAYTTNLAGAYSVSRLLLTGFPGSLIRVRRSSDDAEMDVSNDAGNLHVVDMLAWSGSDSVYVKTIYDQSGLGRDVTSPTNLHQMRIINAGSLEVNANGNPVMRAPGVGYGKYYNGIEYTAYTGTTMSAVAAAKWGSSIFNHVLGATRSDQSSTNSDERCALFLRPGFGDSNVANVRNSSAITSSAINSSLFWAASARYDGTDGHVDAGTGAASAARTAAFNVTRTIIGASDVYATSMNTDDLFAEAALWFADIGSTAAAAIRSEMATFYGAQA